MPIHNKNHHRSGISSVHTPAWMRLHHDWRFWVAVILMLGAMVIYLGSGDLAWRPHRHSALPISAPGVE